jgi:DNA-binding MarR family transcriptional regulator
MTRPREFDAEEAAVWQAYLDLFRGLRSALDRQLLRDSGLSAADYALLAPLSESDGGLLRARDLGRRVGWERSRLSHQVTRMERRGLVCRERCGDDQRGYMVRLTEAGRTAIEAARPQHLETVRRYFLEPLSRPDQQTLLRILTAMNTRLDDDGVR